MVMLTKDFSVKEFRCRCCNGIPREDLCRPLAEALQELRDLIEGEIGEHPIIVNCGYRCQWHNTEVGGSPNSQHLRGLAADIRVDGLKPVEVARFAEQIEAFKSSGIGIYKTFVHLDIGRKVPWRRK
jgi:uncharacterized protein YcbK (DUF882 family)